MKKKIDKLAAARGTRWGMAAGSFAMALVGGSVGVSRTLTDAPLFTTQAIRYAVASVILCCAAVVSGVRVLRPRCREWFWLAGVAALGLVLFNVAVVRGVAHAEPAVIAVAVACVPVVLSLIGPLLEQRKLRPAVLRAAIVVTIGAAVIEGTGRTDAVGLSCALITLICECCFTLLAVPVLTRHGPWGVSVHSVWIGAVMFGVLGSIWEGPQAAGRLSACP